MSLIEIAISVKKAKKRKCSKERVKLNFAGIPLFLDYRERLELTLLIDIDSTSKE